MNIEDTIAAVATPPGRGAISIVRVSGNDAIKILKKIFIPNTKSDLSISGVYVGKIKDVHRIVDEVVVIVYRKPHSFTGEELVEIDCHGGIIVTQDVLNTFIKYGVRIANPGEFTLRAFLNKKIDLPQAESINDLINAKTEKSKEYALSNLFGRFSKYIENISDELKDLLIKMEVAFDHPDEDIEFITKKEITSIVNNINIKIDKLLSTAQTGKAFNYGINAVIVGKANVGKSSLFNILLKKDRAIISEIPGTTRDVIEDWIDIQGLPVKLIDTAGFKFAFNLIEESALKKTEQAIETASIIVAVFDASERLEKVDMQLIEKLKKIESKTIFVLNKTDLVEKLEYNKLKEDVKSKLIRVSALTGSGIEKVEKSIYNLALNSTQDEDIIVTNTRYESLLKNCRDYLSEVLKAIKDNMPEDIVASDIRRAIKELEEITGKWTTDEMLNSIFSNFCIGK